MQMNLKNIEFIKSIIFQRRYYDTNNANQNNKYINSFKIKYSIDNQYWIDLPDIYNTNLSIITRNNKSEIILNSVVKAKYVRIYPQTWNEYISMRAGLVLLKQKPEITYNVPEYA